MAHRCHREPSPVVGRGAVTRRGYATSPSPFWRRTVLRQNGGPRLGERRGTSVGSPMARWSSTTGGKSKSVSTPESVRSSPFLTTSEAARYCRFRSNAGLRKAWYRGDVFPTSRRGGKGTLVWHVDELARFLRGKASRPDKLWPSGC